VAPAWFAPVQLQLNNIQAQLNNMQTQQNNNLLKLNALAHNYVSRLRNSKVMDDLQFGVIRSEAIGPNLNEVPPFFPLNQAALYNLTLAQLDQLEDFYAADFVGPNVSTRRQAFATFIGRF